MYKKILLICFLFSLMILIPKNKFNEETSYVSSEKKLSYIYLLDNNNYLAKTDIQVKDEIKDLIDALIIDGPMEENIPSGFKSVINENTKLINYEINNKTLKLNFNKYLLEDNKDQVIESLVYTLTELEYIDNIILYIDGVIYKDGLLDRSIGINKIYNINDLNNVNKVTVYYSKVFNDKTYYVPVTKYLNDNREKITIIIDELNSTSLYTTNLMSFLNQDVKLINCIENNEELILEFNDAILNSENIILDEVIYTLIYSIKDNYDVKKVTFLVENKEILKKVLH